MVVDPFDGGAAIEQLLHVRDWVRLAASALTRAGVHCGHGYSGPSHEATTLVAHTLALAPAELTDHLGARLLPSEREAIAAVLTRRIRERVPLPYLIGEAWLGDWRFRSDTRALIPRSFIFELLPGGLTSWVGDEHEVGSVLELCTGSGCLAIVLAHAYPNARITATDLSPDALALAALNVADYELCERINLRHGDLYCALDSKDRGYQLIIANPPYVNAASMSSLPLEYRHEPDLALAGGVDGLDLIRRLLDRARDFLTDDGLLVVEVGHNRSALEHAYPRLPFVWLPTSGGDEMVFALSARDLA